MAEGSDDGGLRLLMEAISFAAERHRDQRRKDPYGSPYINHPIRVANVLMKEGGVSDIATLQAAILHDTLEDTATEEYELETLFGHEVSSIVKECSDDKRQSKWLRKKSQIDKAAGKSNKAKLVSLADKLDNLQDLDKNPPPSWDQQRINLYFTWSAQVLHGLRGTNQVIETTLENLLTKNGVSMLNPDPDTSCQIWRKYEN